MDMKYLKKFESNKEINMEVVSDIFTELLDNGCYIHIWQFPTRNGKKWGGNEFSSKMTYDGTSNASVKLVIEKEYWFEISSPGETIPDQGSFVDYGRSRTDRIGKFIENYNYESIINRMKLIGFSIYEIKKDVTKWYQGIGNPTHDVPKVILISQVY